MTKDEHAKIRAIAVEIVRDLMENEPFVEKEEDMWKALEGRMFDKSILVRRQAIEDVVALIKKGCQAETKERLISLLAQIALDNKFKSLSERIIFGLYEIWTGNFKQCKGEEAENQNRKIAQGILQNLMSILKAKEITIESLSIIASKVFLFKKMFLDC